MKRIGNVTAFFSEFDQFSNFYRCELLIRGLVFNCSEQAFMYTKAMYFKDERTARKILEAEMPWLQKKLGRQVRGFDKPTWDRVSLHFMRVIVGEKLMQHAKIRDALMKTEDTIIVEAAENDEIWGAGIGIDDPRISDPTLWPGENKLGEVYMYHRAKYRNPGDHPI
jgi:ribA/ribD-fused uncharacterized protein